ncbi:FUSC family protein [Clostridium sp.]|uniref:FUSC family protein n=1 Tax=Clostridium sp. TaxID=1506 RepID=UPI002FC8C043
MNQILKKFKDTIPVAVLSLIILFINLRFFGINNIIIAPYMTLTFIRMKNYIMIEKNITKPLYIHLLIGVVASLASIGVAHTIIINLSAIFLLAYFLTDDYNPDSYFPYLMAFVFLQLFTTPISEIPKRLLAIVTSYTVVFIFLLLFSKRGIKSHIKILIEKGKESVLTELRYLYSGELSKLEKEQYNLFEICKELNRVVYSSGKGEYYPFIILFQHFNNIIAEFIDNKMQTKEDKVYIKNLENLILKLKVNKNINLEISSNLIIDFLNTYKLEDKYMNTYIGFILNYLISAIKEFKGAQKSTIKKLFDFSNSSCYFNKYKISLNEFKIRFALRITILLTLAFTSIKLFQIPKGYWIPMTIFLLTLPFYEDSKIRIKQRFKGTLIGIIISFVLFSIFKDMQAHIVIIVISTILMYYFSDYKIMTIYVTCYALAISTITMGDGEAVLLRICYTGISAVVVLFANNFLFPNKNHIELINMLHKLIELDKILLIKIDEMLEGKFDLEEIKKILFSSYLISGRLQIHFQSLDSKELKEVIFRNNQFTTLIIHSCVILSLEKKDCIDECYVEKCTENMKEIFDSIYNGTYKSCCNINLVDHSDSYKNYKLLECIKKASDVSDSIQKLKKKI